MGIRATAAAIALVLLGAAGFAPAATADPGDLDPTFGSMGLVDLPSAGGSTDVVVEPDGDIYVARGGLSGPDPMTIVRLRPGGTLDQSFGDAGTADLTKLVTMPFAEWPREFNGIEDTPAGEIIASFQTGPIATPFMNGVQVFVRISPDGSIDDSYGENGLSEIPRDFPAYGVGLFDVDSAGRVVYPGEDAVHRLDADGDPDPTFAGDGSSSTPFSPELVEVAPDDSVYVLGPRSVIHLLPSGLPDPAYAVGGEAVISDEAGRGGAMKLAPSGDLYLQTRYTQLVNGIQRTTVRSVHLRPDGSIDPGFEADGSTGFGMEFDQEGRLLIPSGASPGENHPYGMAVARFDPPGQPDPGFGYGGVGFGIFTPDLARGLTGSGVGAIAVQSDGSIVAAGGLSFRGFDTYGLGVARFLDGPGPSDADADGLEDAADACPYLGSAAHEGCSTVGSAVKAHSARYRLQGTVESPDAACADRARLQIVRVRRGKRSRAGTTPAHLREGDIEATFRTRRLHRGRYFIRRPPEVASDRYAFGPKAGEPLGAGYCVAGRSYVVGLPGTLHP